MGLVGGLKNSEMLTDAYGGVGGWVKKTRKFLRMLTGRGGGFGEIGCLRNHILSKQKKALWVGGFKILNAYGCLRWGWWVG